MAIALTADAAIQVNNFAGVDLSPIGRLSKIVSILAIPVIGMLALARLPCVSAGASDVVVCYNNCISEGGTSYLCAILCAPKIFL